MKTYKSINQEFCNAGYTLIDKLINNSTNPISIEVTVYDNIGFTTLAYIGKQFKDGSRGESEMAPPEKASVSCICCGGIQEEVNEEICNTCKEDGRYPADIYGY